MWVDRKQAEFITKKKTELSEPFYIYFPQKNGKLMKKEEKLPQICLNEGDFLQERISTGTKYALEMWLKSKVSE